MPSLYATIETGRASRYLVQFCNHAAAMGGRGGHGSRIHGPGASVGREVRVAAEWTDTTGTVTFVPWGHCALTADGTTLTLLIEAADDDSLTQIREVVTRDLERFGHRDPLTMTWQAVETPDAAPPQPGTTE